MKKIWDFNQLHYAFNKDNPNPDGACLAICVRWAKMMLTATKDSSLVPQLTSEQRDRKFAKPSTQQRIKSAQQHHNDSIGRVQADQRTLLTASRAQPIIKGHISAAENQNFTRAISQGIGLVGKNLDAAYQKIFDERRINWCDTDKVDAFDEYFADVQPGACYIFICNEAEHAFAGYVTSGTFYWDRYFFDPNQGEYLAHGSIESELLLKEVTKRYRFKGKCSRCRVSL